MREHEQGATTAGRARDHRQLAREFALLACWMIAPLVAAYALYLALWQDGLGIDSHAYWVAGRADDPYDNDPGERDAFLYSPVFALALRPIAILPWPVFFTLWSVAVVWAFLWLTRPMPMRWRIPTLLVCVPEILIGNVTAFFAVMLVLGLQRPALWSLGAVTKIAPGLLGPVWFLARREWKHLAFAIGLPAILAAASWVVAPDLWSEWFALLAENDSDQQAWSAYLRFALAVALMGWAALGERRWLVPVAGLLALPHAQGTIQDFVILVALARSMGRTPHPDTAPSLTQTRRQGHSGA